LGASPPREPLEPEPAPPAERRRPTEKAELSGLIGNLRTRGGAFGTALGVYPSKITGIIWGVAALWPGLPQLYLQLQV
jgi:hypothetical protein